MAALDSQTASPELAGEPRASSLLVLALELGALALAAALAAAALRSRRGASLASMLLAYLTCRRAPRLVAAGAGAGPPLAAVGGAGAGASVAARTLALLGLSSVLSQTAAPTGRPHRASSDHASGRSGDGGGGGGGGGGDGSGVELAERSALTVRLRGLADGETPLLSREDVERLSRHLPSRCLGLDLVLLFCTHTHGYNLMTLFRRVRGRGPTLLVLMDEESHVLGGFASRDWGGDGLVTGRVTAPFRMARAPPTGGGLPVGAAYFGSGESFIFQVRPEFRVHHWTRRNNYFMLARDSCLAFGGGGGGFGLHIDASLQQGVSAPCETYGNEASLAGRGCDTFKIVRLEVWGFTTSRVSVRGP